MGCDFLLRCYELIRDSHVAQHIRHRTMLVLRDQEWKYTDWNGYGAIFTPSFFII